MSRAEEGGVPITDYPVFLICARHQGHNGERNVSVPACSFLRCVGLNTPAVTSAAAAAFSLDF
jgi:hypothetical protein